MRVGRAHALAILFVIGAASPARAQLAVRTLEHGEWAGAVATLQSQPEVDRTLHVVVEDGAGARSPCGRYFLILDAAAQRAFSVGTCDPTTQATALELVSREALFELGDVVARPRTVQIAAFEVRQGSAEGRAAQPVSSELACSLALRPQLYDLLRGVHVRAAPERFELRPIGGAPAEIEAVAEGWTVRSGSVRFEYELVDRRTREVVLREVVRLECGRETVEPASDGVWTGDTSLAAGDDHGSCGGRGAPEEWRALRLDAPSRLVVRVVASFDAAIYLRAGSQHGVEVACRDESTRLETLDIHLDAGTYYLAVDGNAERGRYRLETYRYPPDPAALAPGGRIIPGRDVEHVLAPGVSRVRGRCGGDHAAEHVYALRVDEPTWVSLRVEARFDAVVSLRDARGAEIECGVVLGYPGEVRMPRAFAALEPGDYTVVVDGATRRSGSGAYRLGLDFLRLRSIPPR